VAVAQMITAGWKRRRWRAVKSTGTLVGLAAG
jgi:hypothetical protein